MVGTDYRKVQVFVASPGDVTFERTALARVVDELNLTISAIAPEKKVVLELLRWETHVHPAMGDGPQPEVNRQIGKYDIFVGILWKRMGTRTAAAASGTEEEFDRAYKLWEENRTLPILFYFCQQPFPPPRRIDEVRQLGQVVRFRKKISRKGIVADYATHEAFADAVRPHLLLVLGRMLSPVTSAAEAADRITAHAAEGSDTVVRQQIAVLAAEYETVRATMDSGPTRTRTMEVLASRMRAQALPGYALLPELTASPSPGMRLAAATFLQAIPNPEYIPWLEERFCAESPFFGYNAALALLSLARAAEKSDCAKLGNALDVTQGHLRSQIRVGAKLTDRFSILEEARRELEERCDGRSRKSLKKK